MENLELFELAKSTQKNAFAPISKFFVGAAVRGGSGKTYAGCNVESPTFTSSTHAECNAIDSAIAAGEKEIVEVLVVTNSPEPVFPCAICRQKIAEHSSDALVHAATNEGRIDSAKISELYPHPFKSYQS
jgi:cytidine deaminase